MNNLLKKSALSFLLFVACGAVNADNTEISNTPLVTSSTADVRPNMMFILDDSGSMNFDFAPDWVNYGNDAEYCKASTGKAVDGCCPNSGGERCSEYKTTNPPFNIGSTAQRPGTAFAAYSFNRLYYDPSIVYNPPKKADATDYTSKNAANTSNWTAVPMDGFGIQDVNRNIDLTSKYPETLWCDSNNTSVCTYNSNDYVQPNSLFNTYSGAYSSPYYYAIIPGEYCDSAKLTNCTISSTATGAYTHPAYLRWCSDTALTTCQALRNSTYTYARYATVNPNGNNAVLYTVTGKSTAGSNKTATVNSISVATGTSVLSSATAGSQDVDIVTDRVIANVNLAAYQVTAKSCSTASGNRTCKFLVIAKYNATCPSGNSAVNISHSGGATTSISVSAGSSFSGSCPVPGAFSRVDIVPGNNSYVYPGLASKHSSRSDCAGTTCTYAEEMTNFANWYSYYRTRMQMMKSSVSLAFSNIDDTYRVGYFSINNNTSNDYLNIATYDSTQKSAWYTKVLKAYPGNGTPLRSALSSAGLIYGGVMNGNSFNGSTVVDPVEYSCQKNYTLLSTDGYWNTGNDSACSGRSGAGCKLDRTSSIGNSDGTAARPYIDNQINNATYQTVASGPTTVVVTQRQDKTDVVYERRVYDSSTKSNCSGSKRKDRWNVERRTTSVTADKTITTTTVDNTTLTQTYVNNIQQSSTTTQNPITTVDATVGSSSTSNTAWAYYSGQHTGSCTSSYHDDGETTTAVAIDETTTVLSGPTAVSSNTDATTTTTGPTLTASSTSGGTSNTLADVAYYYYITDLRANGSMGARGVDVGTENNVPANGEDKASHQHMTTYTLGLGVDGFMQYDPNYMTQASGDYFNIKNAQLASANNCTWQTIGTTCNWPVPASSSQANIDDMWHAAVNGRGTHFSAQNPAELSSSLAKVLADVKSVLGSSAAATTSTPTITAGDNFLFASTYQTGEWTGELARYQIDTISGEIAETPDWKASALLDAKTSAATDTRTIYTFNGDSAFTGACGTSITASRKLKPFCWTGSGSSYGTDTSLTTDEQAYFGTASINTLTQSCGTTTYLHPVYAITRNCLTAVEKTAAAGKLLVNYLRGQIGNEDSTAAAAGEYFRNRAHILGDLVSSEAVYVKKPQRNYSDSGFTAFQNANANRKAMVYVSGNDGMLHAFNATSGEEEWGYIPSMVLPNLHKLADVSYADSHRFFVDGSVIVRDAFLDGSWKTVLIGGLGAGGQGYFALDVTDPDAPKALWEFKARISGCAATTAAAVGDTTDCDLGLSYGNPIVSKLESGNWVVMVTSGYNNAFTGDGKGYLYVLNIETGAILNKIGTDAGATTAYGPCLTGPCPSGLARIEAWVNNVQTDNTTDRVYGGDLLGNVWRFDINDKYGPPGTDAFKVAELTGPNGTAQAITSKIGLAEHKDDPILLVGSGRYLGQSDMNAADMRSPNLQSFWGFVDKINDPAWAGWGELRAQDPAPVAQTLTNATDPDTGAAIRIGSSNPVDFKQVPGWYIDLPDNGERVNTDPLVVFSNIIFISNVPAASACTTGGYSYLNTLTIFGIGTSIKNTAALASRPTAYQTEGGDIWVNTSLSTGKQSTTKGPPPGSGEALKRVSWRLLQSDE